MDDRLRSAGHDARTEIESALDTETELATLHAAAANGVTPNAAVVIPPVSRRRTPALLGAAAAMIAVVGGAIWFSSSDDSITTSAPSTTASLSTAQAPTTARLNPTTPPPTDATTPVTTSTITSTIATTTSTTTSTTTTSAPTTPTSAVDWRELRWELTAVGRSCDDETEGVRCVQVIHAADGTMITYDLGTNVLTRHSTPPVTAALPDGYGDTSAVVAVGPEDVVYLQADPTVRSEEAMAIVAVSLTAGDAGREIARWDEARRFGPTQLVPGPDGLVECCRGGSAVPPPDAAVVVPWVDSAGLSVATTGPAITADIDASTVTIRRVDIAGTRAWAVALRSDSTLDGRSVRVTPTFDGGFIAILYDADGTTIARGYADGRVDRVVLLDRSTMIGGVEAIDPSGRFLVQTDAGAFARVDPFPGAAPTWGGAVEVDVEGTGAIALPGIDEAIDAGPTWASDPVAFAAAVAGEPEVNEQRTIDAAEQEGGGWTVTVTTSNLFDDSAFATRWELVVRRDDAGSLRFVSGEWTQACQPDRGHQDFRAELCV
jgi:hypothetical protein